MSTSSRLKGAALAAAALLSAACLPAVTEPPLPHTRGAEYRYVLAGGVRTAYIDAGAGEPLLFIHGFTGEIWNWEHQIRYFAPGHRVVAVDLVGWGYSEKPKIDYTPEAFIDFIDSFMEAAGLPSATLIGNSMGGAVAWGCAIRHPERVRRLVLIDSVSPDVVSELENSMFLLLKAIRFWPVVSDLAVKYQPPFLSRRLLREFLHDDDLATPEVVSLFHRRLKAPGMRRVVLSATRRVDGWKDYEEALARISVPTLVIWGMEDEVFSPMVGVRLHEKIEGSHFRVAEDAGHFPMWEAPDVVNEEIRSFLRETRPAERAAR